MSTYALELANVTKSFGKTAIIRGVNLAVNKGERVAVIGPNGAGKSTLFNLISGRFEPTSGSIKLHGTEIIGERPYEISRRGLARSFQITNIFSRLSVFENLRCAALFSSGQKYSFWKPLSKLDELSAMQFDAAAGGLEAPADEVEQRALARAIRADDSDALALVHREIDAANDGGFAEAFGDVREFQCVAHAQSPSQRAETGCSARSRAARDGDSTKSTATDRASTRRGDAPVSAMMRGIFIRLLPPLS